MEKVRSWRKSGPAGKSPKSDGKSPKWRNSDGKSPKMEKVLWKKSDGESPMETGESPLEKVRSGRKKSCVGIFRWKKSEIRKKSENGPCVYSFFQKFHDEFNPHIFGPFRGLRPEIARSASLDQKRCHPFRPLCQNR